MKLSRGTSIVLLFIGILCFGEVSAQDELFGTQKKDAKKGFILNFNGAIDFPGADLADRFGGSFKVGGAVLYKTKSNWMFGPKIDFIFGNKIREDSLLLEFRNNDQFSFISNSGQRIGANIFQRGYMVGIQAGKIFNTSKKSSDVGIMTMTTVGFMEHKILIVDRDGTIPQLSKEYKKGYDRLTNGLFVGQYVGYVHFSNNALVNFHIGLELNAGFTAGRRSYQFDLMRTDNEKRLDLMFGIRGGWYIPLFKTKSDDIFF